jgi:hypothetical protein
MKIKVTNLSFHSMKEYVAQAHHTLVKINRKIPEVSDHLTLRKVREGCA